MCGEAVVDVLVVVHEPDVTRRIDGEISQHLQTASHTTAERRSPVFMPAGQVSVRTPHKTTSGLWGPVKLEN
jgi:hypothetical protein